MGKPDKPDAPNTSGLNKKMNKIAKKNAKIYKKKSKKLNKALKNVKKTTNDLKNTANNVSAAGGATFGQGQKTAEAAGQFWNMVAPAAKNMLGFGKSQIGRYKAQGIPLENEYVNQLRNWDSPARREAAAAQASQDVGMAFEAQRENQMRQLESYGIDPSQVRSGALDANMRSAQALGQAQASTQARRASEREGLEMKGVGVNVMQNVANMGMQASQLGAQMGATGVSAMGAGTNAMATGVNAMGVGMQGLGMAVDAGLGMGNLVNQSAAIGNQVAVGNAGIINSGYQTANSIYGNQLQSYETQLANSPLNTLAGIAGTWLGAGMPGLKEGGYITHQASPSGGAIPDDVHTMLSAGEVVLPEDVVRYHGLEKINKLYAAARKSKTGAPAHAIPEV